MVQIFVSDEDDEGAPKADAPKRPAANRRVSASPAPATSPGPASAPAVPPALARKLGIVARRASIVDIVKRDIAASADEGGAQNEPASQASTKKASKKSDEVIAAADQNDDGESDESPLLENPETEMAVDQILAHEADELLAIDDARAQNEADAVRHEKLGSRLGSFFSAWWHNALLRWLTLLIIFGGIGALAGTPQTRYFILNKAGVRVSASLTLTATSTQQPLAGATVQIGSSTVQTDASGVAKFTHLKLGPQSLRISQIGFAIVNQPLTLGWGSNPLGGFALNATGIQYTVKVQDYLSGKPVAGASASFDGATAEGDSHGTIVLAVPAGSGTAPAATVAANGYRSAAITLNPKVAVDVRLVPSGKAVFAAKTGGKYNIYDTDLDGQNQQLLLAGTGSETSAISLATSPANDEAAVVSLRNNLHDSTGAALNSLTLVSLGSGQSVTIDTAQQIRLIDWVDTTIIYELTTTSDAASNPSRSRIMSYDYANSTRMQLATAGQFAVATSVQGVVYYAESPNDGNANAQPGLFSVNPDGSARQTVTSQAVQVAFRADYSTLDIQTAVGWSAFNVDTSQLQNTSVPTSLDGRQYVASPTGQQAAWIGVNSSGQNALLVYNVGAGKDTPLETQGAAVGYPLFWANAVSVVYQTGGSEPAEYAAGLNGGIQKIPISNFVPTTGFTQGT